MFTRKALYTGVAHEPDLMCGYGACYSKCTPRRKNNNKIEYIYDGVEDGYYTERNVYRFSRKEYLKGLRIKNFQKLVQYCDKNQSHLTAEFLAGAADNENIGKQHLIYLYRQLKHLPARSNMMAMRLASHPYAGNVLTTVLAQEGTEMVRKIVAERPDLPQKAQQTLAFDPSKHVKYVLRNNIYVEDQYRVLASL